MKKILITTCFGDTDSMLIAAALESRGNFVIRWIGDNYPSLQRSSVKIQSPFGLCGEIIERDQVIQFNGIDVVFLRRPRWPVPSEYLHESDQRFAHDECKSFIRQLFQAAWQDATWVNSLDGRRRAGSKILQLKVATEVGFIIPATTITNNPVDIKNFLENHKTVIVKPLAGGYWKESNGNKVTYTSSVEMSDLPTDHLIQACPCIFQKKIEKQYEARVTIFGHEVLSAKISSQSRKESMTDWRTCDPITQSMEIIDTPTHIIDQCKKIMERLGILHGSFDFAIDSDDNWIFFEVNEAGQFLWLEECVPELKVLETAVQFLERPSRDFRLDKSRHPLTFDKVRNSARVLELLNHDSFNLSSPDASAIL